MTFWNDSEQLEIVLEDKYVDKLYIKYPLYEANFKFAIKSIFNMISSNLDNGDRILESNVLLKKDKGNIFTFIGQRGAGKTTAMNEFCYILEEMSGDEQKKRWWLKQSCENGIDQMFRDKNIRFHVLHPIDASLLEQKEDLFEIILAGLYNMFVTPCFENMMRHIESVKIAKINQSFENILKRYRNLSNRASSNELSMTSLMQFIGSSSDIKKDLKNLLKEITAVRNSRFDCEYFVIAIDDLDLNLEYGYQMLEQLQKYFSLDNIIILVAVDYEQMGYVCTEHFHKWMSYAAQETGGVSGVKREHYDRHSKTLANNYMTKVFPLSKRVFLPDMSKITKKAKIKLDYKQSITIKEFVMAKIAYTMRIYYDACGTKMHFCEPETVRYLVAYNDFLHNLNQIQYDKLIKFGLNKLDEDTQKIASIENEQILHLYDKNHERFNWEIRERQAQTTLSPSQMTDFKDWLSFDLKRRPAYFIRMCSRGDYNIDGFEKNYFLGDLLETIYTYGRKEWRNKAYISCVIASFTSEMVREYMIYTYHPDKSKRELSKERLLAFLGNSFGSTWVGDIVPKAITVLNRDILFTDFGFSKRIMLHNLGIKFSIELLEELKESDCNNYLEIFDKWLKRTQIVASLECIDMFCVRKEGKSYRGIDFDIGLDNPKAKDVLFGAVKKLHENNFVLNVRARNYGEYSLDVMAFVAKSLDYRENKRELHRNIADGLIGMLKGYLKNPELWDSLKSAIPRLIGENSILPEIGYSEEIAFPFYNLDMAYNIIKRVRNEQLGKRIHHKMIPYTLYDTYNKIEESLLQEEKAYIKISETLKVPYADNFANCPYMLMFRAIFDMPQEYHIVREALSQALIQLVERENTPEDTSDN